MEQALNGFSLGAFSLKQVLNKIPEYFVIIDWGQTALPWELGGSSEIIHFCTFCQINTQAPNVHLHSHHKQIMIVWLMPHTSTRAICVGFSCLRGAQ